ncbi:MAG: hypothetical protein HYZ08_02525 [Candidatus Kerfeldbacteria bacterium]|nr:hypothetical protein [Candidatus Kerfeldbacteria bacterium]
MRNPFLPSGQGLLETIIALAIVTTGVVASLALISTSIISTRLQSNESVAVQLAREGIEVVRARRDSNWLQRDARAESVEWDAQLDGNADATAVPLFDPATRQWNVDFSVTDFSDPKTRVYEDNGMFRQFAGTPQGTETTFQRMLLLTEICAPVEDPQFLGIGQTCPTSFDERKIGIRVVSRVRIEDDAIRDVVVEDHLYQWKGVTE